jgi:hypothetical protein
VGKSVFGGSSAVYSWWYRRKVALIARSIQHAKQADAMQPQLRRLFGSELSDDELEFIDQYPP